MTEYINEFITVSQTAGVYRFPADENIISLYIRNNSSKGGTILLQGFQFNNSFNLLPGKTLYIKGKENENFRSVLYFSFDQYVSSSIFVNPGDINEQIKNLYIIIKRKIN